jgi:hypothetical protein
LLWIYCEIAVVGCDLGVESDDGGHAGLHGVVVLRPSTHLHEVSALVGHIEGLFLRGRREGGGNQEILDALLEFLGEEQLEGAVEDLVPLVAEEGGAAGIDVDDGAVVGLINADQHDGAAAVGPILQHDLLLQTVILLHRLVDLVVHVLVVLDGLQVVDVETGGLLAVGDAADVAVALLHLLPDIDAVGAHFVQLLEVGVVFVQDAPELQVYQRCSLEFPQDGLFLPLDAQLADEV